MPEDWEPAWTAAERIHEALSGPEHSPVPCHDDLLPANILRDGERIWLVDWEYAGMGDRYFDLANLAVNNEFSPEDDRRLFESYWGEPATPARLAALALMRVMSDFREAMWGVVQVVLSDLDFDFQDYAARHFARMHHSIGEPWFEERSMPRPRELPNRARVVIIGGGVGERRSPTTWRSSAKRTWSCSIATS